MSTVNIRIYTYTGENGRWNSFSSKGTITCFRPDLTAEVRRTVYLLCALINYLISHFRPFLARNGSGTPRYRWPCGATAGLSACIVVCQWGYRSGLSSIAQLEAFLKRFSRRLLICRIWLTRQEQARTFRIRFFIWPKQVPGFIISSW